MIYKSALAILLVLGIYAWAQYPYYKEPRCQHQKDCAEGFVCAESWGIPDVHGTPPHTCKQSCESDLDCVNPAMDTNCLKAYFYLKSKHAKVLCSCPAGTSYRRCEKTPDNHNVCGMPTVFQDYGLPNCLNADL